MEPLTLRPFKAKYCRIFLLSTLVFTIAACTGTNHEKEKDGNPEKKVIESKTGDLFSKEAFVQSLAASLHRVDTLDSNFRKRGVTPGNALAYTYQRIGYQPLWVEEAGITEAAVTLINELDSLRLDGLNPERYGRKKLSAALDKIKAAKPTLAEVIAFDTACTNSYLHASHHLLFGLVSPKIADNQWFHTNDTFWRAPRNLYTKLNNEAKYTALNTYRPQLPTYALLRQEYGRYFNLAHDQTLLSYKSKIQFSDPLSDSGIRYIIQKEDPWATTVADDSLSAGGQMLRAFQEARGLAPSAKMDSTTFRALAMSPDSVLATIAANMERIRWMPQQMENQYVLVNIPLMELFYKKDGADAFHMRVVVGKPARQTPALNADMANVVFSPPWGVPPTILKNDVLPGIAKRGGAYLARKGLKAYNRQGKMVSAGLVTAKNYRSFNFRQPPGARNALGEVKFNLPNKWDIYLHDTPHREDFAKRFRARSSGCVRVAHPREFAEFILKDIEGRNFDQQIIDSIIQTRQTRFEQLSKKIPVHIIYLTAFEDSTSTHIRLLTDVYHRDARLIAAMAN